MTDIARVVVLEKHEAALAAHVLRVRTPWPVLQGERLTARRDEGA
jgi:hypothetical protein